MPSFGIVLVFENKSIYNIIWQYDMSLSHVIFFNWFVKRSWDFSIIQDCLNINVYQSFFKLDLQLKYMES
jgi:hypothetical protein